MPVAESDSEEEEDEEEEDFESEAEEGEDGGVSSQTSAHRYPSRSTRLTRNSAASDRKWTGRHNRHNPITHEAQTVALTHLASLSMAGFQRAERRLTVTAVGRLAGRDVTTGTLTEPHPSAQTGRRRKPLSAGHSRERQRGQL